MRRNVFIGLCALAFIVTTDESLLGIPISYGIQYQFPFKLVGFLPVPDQPFPMIGARLWLEELGGGAWIKLDPQFLQFEGYLLEMSWKAYEFGEKILFLSGGPWLSLTPIEVGLYASVEMTLLKFYFLDVGFNLWVKGMVSGSRFGISVTGYFNSLFFTRAPSPER